MDVTSVGSDEDSRSTTGSSSLATLKERLREHQAKTCRGVEGTFSLFQELEYGLNVLRWTRNVLHTSL